MKELTEEQRNLLSPLLQLVCHQSLTEINHLGVSVPGTGTEKNC